MGKYKSIYIKTEDTQYIVAFENMIKQQGEDKRRKKSDFSNKVVELIKKEVAAHNIKIEPEKQAEPVFDAKRGQEPVQVGVGV